MSYVKHILSNLRGLQAPLNKDNWKAVVLCLITAFIFWLFNALNKTYTTHIDYPISFQFNRDSLISINKLPQRIPLNVSGGGWNLLRKTLSVNPHPIVVNFDNPVNTQYVTQYSLMPIVSDNLEELTINFVGIDTLYIRIEKKVSKKVKLKVDTLDLAMAQDFAINSPVNISPDSVELTGPESMITQHSDTLYVKIPEDDIDEDYSEEVALGSQLDEHIVSAPDIVNVSFKVVQYVPVTEEFYIEKVNFPDDNSIKLDREVVKANFKVPEPVKDNIEIFDFSVIADFNNLMLSDSTIELESVRIPEYVRAFSLLENKVKVSQVNEQ